ARRPAPARPLRSRPGAGPWQTWPPARSGRRSASPPRARSRVTQIEQRGQRYDEGARRPPAENTGRHTVDGRGVRPGHAADEEIKRPTQVLVGRVAGLTPA